MFKGLFSEYPQAGDQLITAYIRNSGFGCDPLIGSGRLFWLAVGDLTGATIELYADFGSGYFVVATGIDPTDPYLDFVVGGDPGFTSLDSTNFRVDLKFGVLDLQGSPIFLTPNYACL